MANVVNLPGGLVLGSNESLLQTFDFKFSLTHFFLNSRVALTNRRISGESPNTLLGIIPVGSHRFNLPLPNIASVVAQTGPRLGRIVFGLLLAILGIALLGQTPATIILSLVGVVIFLAGFKTELQITNNAGQFVRLEVIIFERQRAQEFADLVNREIVNLA